MRVAIVGSSGYIAGFLLERFEKDVAISSVIKIDQTDNSDYFLNLLRPEQFDYSVLNDVDYVVFTAAISGPDKCAEEYEFCYKINVTGTIYFIKEAINRNCKVIFFSSDAVFGNDIGIFNELSETRANTPYGKMKKEVEDVCKEFVAFKAIRLSYVVSARDRFVSYCLKCLKDNVTAEVFHPFYRNCISVKDVVDAVDWLIKNWYEFDGRFLNIANKELISRVRIADEINRLAGGKLDYVIKLPTEVFFHNRPKITQMESLYLYCRRIIKEESFSEKIKYELKEIIK